MTIWAILPAAGIGRRMGSPIPKQYLTLAGKPVIQHSMEKLLRVSALRELVIALHPEDEHFEKLKLPDDRLSLVSGGDTRQESVLNALIAMSTRAKHDDIVLIHDAVRPCVLVEDIERLLESIAGQDAGALLATPQDNTLKTVDRAGKLEETVDRSRYWQALTPQGFPYGLMLEAMQEAVAAGMAITDEASAIEAKGLRPLLVEGDRNNIKITRESDLHLAEAILKSQQGET